MRFFIIGGLIVFALALTVGLESFYQVNEGERGVVVTAGRVVDVAEPGINFKTPFITDVPTVSVRTNNFPFTTEAYSRDQQIATIAGSVSYRIPADDESIEMVYSTYQTEQNLVSRIIETRVRDRLKTVFGQFNAASAIQNRGELNAEVTAALTAALADEPVILESIQIEDIAFSDAYDASIEARMQAEVEVQKREQEARTAEVTAQIAVIEAQARADSHLAQAQAAAEAVRMQGEAEADAIRARGEALRDNPALIQLVTAENWDGVLPTTMLPNSTVPFLDMTSSLKPTN